MGEHGSWSDFLYYLPGWKSLEENAGRMLGREDEFLLIFKETHFALTHVVWAFVVLLFILAGSLTFSAAVNKKDGIVPPRKFGLRALFEGFVDATFGLMVQVMGEKEARKHLPFIGSLAVFIFFSNILALVPGGGVPTSTLKTNAALAILVFLFSHYYGLKEHGISYLKHFLGPIPLLAPLMLPIELIGHIARPVSLMLRLMGNMAADHKVLFTFTFLVPLLVPIPFYLLGLLVCTVQTLVFCLLTMVYFSMATAHDH